MCRDDGGNITLLSERTIYKVNFYQEDKFIWKVSNDYANFFLDVDILKLPTFPLLSAVQIKIEKVLENHWSFFFLKVW